MGMGLAGVDWAEVFSSVPPYATARAIALAWAPITGTAPIVIDNGDHFALIFDAAQEERAAAWIVGQLNREPGPVRVEAGGIALRVIKEKYWPYFAGAVGVGALLGWALRGTK